LILKYGAYSPIHFHRALSPKVSERPFRCFFSTASGWGSLTLEQESLEIELAEGQLEVEWVVVKTDGQEFNMRPRLIARAGEISSISWIQTK
jgi:hypothetical protein